jgi:glutamate---cysteine ligase / carboxylate-amine ligase
MAQDAINEQDDSVILRQMLKQFNSFPKVVEGQCKIWTT